MEPVIRKIMKKERKSDPTAFASVPFTSIFTESSIRVLIAVTYLSGMQL